MSEPLPAASALNDLLRSDVTIISTTQAHRCRRSLLRRVRGGQCVAITRRGEVELVMLPRQKVEQLERTILKLKRVISSLDSVAKGRHDGQLLPEAEGD